MNKKSLSLLEIVVASAILSIAMLGVTHLFVGTKIYLRHSRCRVQAVNLARWYLDELPLYVRADQYSGGDYVSGHPLASGRHTLSDFWLGTPPIRYQCNYYVSSVSVSGVRRVKSEIKWIEPVFWKSYQY
ncbi:MAG: hypothetical protein NC909_01430 [Candidatus Omnitrophica bacterium]|nr:hypothetical protein [Candidatus Omnitrophota bacterium]